jgi:hypothetical protein
VQSGIDAFGADRDATHRSVPPAFVNANVERAGRDATQPFHGPSLQVRPWQGMRHRAKLGFRATAKGLKPALSCDGETAHAENAR